MPPAFLTKVIWRVISVTWSVQRLESFGRRNARKKSGVMRLASAGIVDIESSAARAASGHAAVPSTTLMNSRRLMPSIGLPTPGKA